MMPCWHHTKNICIPIINGSHHAHIVSVTIISINEVISQPNPPPDQTPNPPPNLPTLMANPDQLNWSYFKPEFAGKPEEDVEAHPHRTNDWIDTHDFPDDTKVRRFCLPLTGEARLRYETLGTAQLGWAALQDHFQQQYSKFGNTREQYFHA